MNKKFFFVFAVLMFSLTRFSFAEDAGAAAEAVVASDTAVKAQAAEVAQAAEDKAMEAVAAPVAEVAAAAETPAAAAEPTENLEFVSGEVTSLDDAAKSLTVKLYGETENAAEKSLTVKVDENTDITDGEKDRELKSLASGTEVDVEYDPSSNKATYIFVY